MVRPRQDSELSVIDIVDLATVREGRNWFIGLGIAFAVLGTLAIFLPFVATLVTTLAIGVLMVLGSIFQGYHAFQNRRWAGSGWALAGAVIQMLAGVFVILFPVAGTMSLTLVLAIYFGVEGIFKIIRAIQHRHMPAQGWLMFDGILSLVLGFMIVTFWPTAAVWLLGLLVGINLLFSGISMLLIARAAGRMIPARL